MLKDSLSGNCKTLLIANVYGEQQHLKETISTLQVGAGLRMLAAKCCLPTSLTHAASLSS